MKQNQLINPLKITNQMKISQISNKNNQKFKKNRV